MTGGPIHFTGKDMWVKLAGGDLPGSVTVLEDITPPQHGPPLRTHPCEEGFYILEGSFCSSWQVSPSAWPPAAVSGREQAATDGAVELGIATDQSNFP